jgi:hypothetical protein
MSMRPVKVTAHLAGPVVLSPDGRLPHLDAVCEFALAGKLRTIAESSRGRHRYDALRPRGMPVAEPGQIPSPFVRERIDGLPVSRVSFGVAAGREDVAHFGRAFPMERAGLLAEDQRIKIATTGGPYRSFRLPLRLLHCGRIGWFAALRERPGVLRHVLKQIDAVGKKTAHGWGRVARWEVEPVDEDLSWYAPAEAGPVLMRALPAVIVPEGTVGARRTFCGVVAPYWQRDFWREAMEPC